MNIFNGFGPFDMVICSGLFDYLRQPIAVKLTSHMHSYSKVDGTVYIGNMVPSNPSRWIMDIILIGTCSTVIMKEILDFAQGNT